VTIQLVSMALHKLSEQVAAKKYFATALSQIIPSEIQTYPWQVNIRSSHEVGDHLSYKTDRLLLMFRALATSSVKSLFTKTFLIRKKNGVQKFSVTITKKKQ
jgi:hypothetical protein